jgi:ATP-dependent helicase HrpB
LAGLPIAEKLDEIRSALTIHKNAVLIAPPGAGKSTMVASALLNEDWCTGQILLLSPRRLAARMIASRIADLHGQQVGGLVGYATRLDSKQSSATRILVLTEGIFRNRVIADPELAGISAVLFDEVHERSLDSDFGLALALEAQAAFRPDLRLLTMSATLDGDRFASLMGSAPIIRSEGQSWPLTLHYIGRKTEIPIEKEVASAIRLAVREEQGDILAFLPGVREIERCSDNLTNLAADFAIHKLHGNAEQTAQSDAMLPDADGRRKIILSTNIAETSLTIDGVRIVVDSGLARRARFDQSAGVTRLVTERVSLSAATQRAGRAARQGPGVAYRLWEKAGNGGLQPFDPPEILESDLAPLLLDCGVWGESDPTRLTWLDQPPLAALEQARQQLLLLKAIDADGNITQHGRAISALPLLPHLAHMMVLCSNDGSGHLAAEVAVLLSERGLGGTDIDIEKRLENWRRDKSARAIAARGLVKSWQGLVSKSTTSGSKFSAAACVAHAFPDRMSKRRDAKGESWISAMGRGLMLDSASPLAVSQWLAVAAIQGVASGARIISAAAVSEQEVLNLFADRIVALQDIRYDAGADRIEARSRRRLGAITLSDAPLASPNPDLIAKVLLDAVLAGGLEMLPWSDGAISLRKRAAFAGMDVLDDGALLNSADAWLLPLLSGVTRLRDVSKSGLSNALDLFLEWDGKRALEQIAPPAFQSPAGTTHEIDYSAEAGPTVELRVQALYGLDQHPTVGVSRIPLVLSLTSPAGRPIQTTRNLPEFWRGSWADVAKEMRGRYPRHVWPDQPWEAKASLKTKNAQARS